MPSTANAGGRVAGQGAAAPATSTPRHPRARDPPIPDATLRAAMFTASSPDAPKRTSLDTDDGVGLPGLDRRDLGDVGSLVAEHRDAAPTRSSVSSGSLPWRPS